MSTKKILLLPGDGIGPETVAASKKVLQAVDEKFGCGFAFSTAHIGGEAIDSFSRPLPDETVAAAKAADAVLLGAVGGAKWDGCPLRPESALLGIRKALGLYANLRPAKLFPSLKNQSALKAEKTDGGIDLVTVRELTGGIYFGERGYRDTEFGRAAYDTELYSELEIERVARVAYELAQKRSKKLCLIDKANVMLSSALWRKVVADLNEDYPDVRVSAMYVDNAAMQLLINPSQFDVILTNNIFGDILSDLTGAIVGSIGVMPSASLGANTLGLYEAIHGSAPDLAGKNVANPIGTILSAALMLKLSLDCVEAGEAIEKAVEAALNDGLGTADIGGSLSTTQMTDEIIKRI